MSAMIIKDRARKALAGGLPHDPEVYPRGVGGIDVHQTCYAFRVGEFRCIMTKDQWMALSNHFRKIDSEC